MVYYSKKINCQKVKSLNLEGIFLSRWRIFREIVDPPSLSQISIA
jgi:hypothetical protein